MSNVANGPRGRLSDHQVATLRTMAEDSRGQSLCPGGYSAAGRDASRWYRTMHILASKQLVRPLSHQCYEITAGGRAVVRPSRAGADAKR